MGRMAVIGMIVTLAAQVAVSAQELATQPVVSLGPIVPFLETTDVFWSPRWRGWYPSFTGASLDKRAEPDQYKPPYIVEANLFPHLVVRQTFTDVLNARARTIRSGQQEAEQKESGNGREWAYSVSGTPGVRVRMLTAESLPVRTPTFTPRINLQLLKVRRLKNLRQSRTATRATVWLWEGHLRAAHYSNGQEGCLSTLQTRPREDEECVPEVGLTAETVNRRTGSFSTNFLALGSNYAWHKVASDGPDQAYASTLEVRGAVEMEWHGGSQDLYRYFSPLRINSTVGAALPNVWICDRRLEGSVSGTLGLLDDEGVSNHSLTAQASCFPSSRGGWGGFVRVFHGQDYYNVQLFEKITRLQIGLTYNQAGFFRFLVNR